MVKINSLLWASGLFIFLCRMSLANESEPHFFVRIDGKNTVYTRSQLLARSDLKTLSVEDPAYQGRPMSYSVIPVYHLFEGVKFSPDATVQFHCLDGFSAPISKNRLLNSSPKKSLAYLAIEKKENEWPPLPSKPGVSAGPFYLVWANPRLSQVHREEWPFQLSGLEVQKSMAEAYPALLPATNISRQSSIRRGMGVFTKNCFPCHTLNRQGLAKMGPDLNIPMSPVEYFKPAALKMLIRDPHTLRNWPNSLMKGFSEKEITDRELNELMDYLEHMSHRKAPAP